MKLFKNRNDNAIVQPYWGIKDIPDLTDKIFLLTGATGAYGRLIAQAIYEHNGSIIIAGRHQEAAYSVIHTLKTQVPSTGVLQFRFVDLNDLNSIRKFVADLQNEVVKLDVLINNAGVKLTGPRSVNKEGIEAHFQMNFFGHFVLTNLLVPLLQMSRDPRVINVSAPLPAFANLKLQDLQLTQNYSNQRAYLQSKLAIQMATFYFQNISNSQELGVKFMATHPGLAKISRQDPSADYQLRLPNWLQALGNPLFGTRKIGVLPTLFAATDPTAVGGKLYAPDGFLHLQGRPQAVRPIAAALDKNSQGQLWVAASELAGFSSWASMANSF